MSSRNEDQASDSAGQAFGLLLIIVGFALVAAFLVSALLVKGLLHLINRQTDGALDRDDGLPPLISATFFALLMLFSLPMIHGAGYPLWSTAVWLMLGGFIWGLAVGYKVLLDWWAEAESHMPAGYDVVQLLDTPIDIRQPAADFEKTTVLEDDELEELILGDGPWS